jgi:hypothetical protein
LGSDILAPLQAKLVARVLSGRVSLPSQMEMEALVKRRKQELEARGIPHRHFHMQGGEQWAFNDSIASMCGDDVAKTPAWVIKMYDESGEL